MFDFDFLKLFSIVGKIFFNFFLKILNLDNKNISNNIKIVFFMF